MFDLDLCNGVNDKYNYHRFIYILIDYINSLFYEILDMTISIIISKYHLHCSSFHIFLLD